MGSNSLLVLGVLLVALKLCQPLLLGHGWAHAFDWVPLDHGQARLCESRHTAEDHGAKDETRRAQEPDADGALRGVDGCCGHRAECSSWHGGRVLHSVESLVSWLVLKVQVPASTICRSATDCSHAQAWSIDSLDGSPGGVGNDDTAAAASSSEAAAQLQVTRIASRQAAGAGILISLCTQHLVHSPTHKRTKSLHSPTHSHPLTYPLNEHGVLCCSGEPEAGLVGEMGWCGGE